MPLADVLRIEARVSSNNNVAVNAFDVRARLQSTLKFSIGFIQEKSKNRRDLKRCVYCSAPCIGHRVQVSKQNRNAGGSCPCETVPFFIDVYCIGCFERFRFSSVREMISAEKFENFYGSQMTGVKQMTLRKAVAASISAGVCSVETVDLTTPTQSPAHAQRPRTKRSLSQPPSAQDQQAKRQKVSDKCQVKVITLKGPVGQLEIKHSVATEFLSITNPGSGTIDTVLKAAMDSVGREMKDSGRIEEYRGYGSLEVCIRNGQKRISGEAHIGALNNNRSRGTTFEEMKSQLKHATSFMKCSLTPAAERAAHAARCPPLAAALVPHDASLEPAVGLLKTLALQARAKKP
eukprot:tig00020531_g10043.t1